jgi:hypothetical protein
MEKMKKVLSPFLEHTDVCNLRWCSNDVKPMSGGTAERNCDKLYVITLSNLSSHRFTLTYTLGLHKNPN